MRVASSARSLVRVVVVVVGCGCGDWAVGDILAGLRGLACVPLAARCLWATKRNTRALS